MEPRNYTRDLNASATIPAPPSIPVLNIISNRLQILVERASKLYDRQVSISTRVFGDRPQKEGGKESISPSGLIGGIDAQLNRLEILLFDMEEETNNFERIA